MYGNAEVFECYYSNIIKVINIKSIFQHIHILNVLLGEQDDIKNPVRQVNEERRGETGLKLSAELQD